MIERPRTEHDRRVVAALPVPTPAQARALAVLFIAAATKKHAS